MGFKSKNEIESMSTATQQTLSKAAATIEALKAAGRNEEAKKLEDLVAESVKQLAEPAAVAESIEKPAEDEIERRMEELSTTTKMIGEHLASGCLKDGKLDKEEVKQGEAFFTKCIPMLEVQLKMLEVSAAKLSAEEQAKHASTLDGAVKCILLLKKLKAMNAEAGVAQCS